MDSLYSRYASALLSIAKDEGRIKEYKDALLEVLSFFNANLETKKYLESYLIPNDAKYEVADKISEPLKLAHLSSFLKILIKINKNLRNNLKIRLMTKIQFQMKHLKTIMRPRKILQNQKLSKQDPYHLKERRSKSLK